MTGTLEYIGAGIIIIFLIIIFCMVLGLGIGLLIKTAHWVLAL